MTRTDVHAPKNLVTEDYELVGYGWFGTSSEPGFDPIGPRGPGHYLLAEGWGFAENHSAGTCYHCGAHCRYYALLKHLPTHSLIRVGETCANRFDLPTTEFHDLRKQAALDREAQRIKKARLLWFAVDPDREVAYEWARENDASEFRYKFVAQIKRYGSVSDAYVRAIMRDMVKTERLAEQRAAEAAISQPVVEGRIEITGEVVAVKWQDNDFGGRLVMTVKDDRHFLVWGSVPRALDGIAKGDRVTFTAEVERSSRDESFGFFRRPSKASRLAA